MQGYQRVDILGCPFDAISFDETLVEVERALADNRRLQVVPGNVDFVMKARRAPDFQALLSELDLIVADGVPITWAASMLGTPLRRRVSGTEFVWRCGEISARRKVGVALIGAASGIADRAAQKMEEAFPGAKLHALPTPMHLGKQENAELVREIKARDAKIILVALGAPRQERWVRDHMEASGALVGAGVGSAFDIISGDKPRAPAWMADNGFEWLHRLTQEPGRLGKRYLVEDSPFVLHLMKEVFMRRALGKPS